MSTQWAIGQPVWICQVDKNGSTRRNAAIISAVADDGTVQAQTVRAPLYFLAFDRNGESRVYPEARMPDAWLKARRE